MHSTSLWSRLALTAAVTFASFVRATSSSSSSDRPIVAQYWAAYGGQSPTASTVDWQPNDLAYYFVTVTTADGFELPEGQSVDQLGEFVQHTKGRGARPVFSVGGWSGSAHFSNLVKTEAGRRAFAKSLDGFMNEHEFVGIDLDWEYPNAAGIGQSLSLFALFFSPSG